MKFFDLAAPLCGGETPTFLWLFDLSTPPDLLYYAYIPIVIVSLLLAAYIFYKDSKSLKSKLLLATTLFFVLWVVDILILWVASYNALLMFAWQLTVFFEVSMFLCVYYFARVFLSGKDIVPTEKIVLSLVALLTIVAVPSTFNVIAYDIDSCEGVNGVLWDVVYGLEPFLIAGIFIYGLKISHLAKDRNQRRQSLIFTLGIVAFLTTFYISNVYGEITGFYEFNLWGPTGMVIFLILLTYLIVKYKVFNVKLFATQVLVLGIAALIGARIFQGTSFEGVVLSVVTLVAFLISGIFLIRSVKREIQQREEIQELAKTLEVANERQETLIHFIGHEVKGFLTKDAGVFASLVEGDFGPLPEPLKPFVSQALEQSRAGADSVANILKASNLKKGTVTYNKAPFNMNALVVETANKAKAMAESKGLKLNVVAAEGNYQMEGDGPQIADHVLRNLIENAINYTPTGTIEVSLKREKDKIIFAVKDSGIGITDEDKKRLFTEGGHGKDSQKVNVHSTGYGLYIAKQIVDAHGGTIRAESEGAGKGSTFIAEFPVK